MERTSTPNGECPGCGLKLPRQNTELDDGYNASVECYQKYNELTSYTISRPDINFIHQHAVDAYAAQHSRVRMKAITTVFPLVGLYYAIEHGFSGKQVQRVHTLLAQRKHKWFPLDPPQTSYSLTVRDVMDEPEGVERDTMLRNWMIDVWACWQHKHDWVRGICRTLLPD